jgi:hypothetical protein
VTAPLGIRSRNPGNLRPSSPPWQGQIGSANGFCVFDTMANGIRALCKNLIAYQRHPDGRGGRIDTVREAISRWAPGEDHNDTEAYIALVCTVLDCNQDDEFDFSDRSFLYWMTIAIGEQENGHDAFLRGVTEADINAGVDAALAA